MRLPKHIPKGTACDDQKNEAQQKNNNVLASFAGHVEGGRIRKHAVDPDGIGDVLDFAISKRLISANQFVLYLLVNAARDINLARRGNTLKTRSNIDSVAVNVVCFDDDVAKVDANPILDPMMPGQRGVASNHVLLDDDAAPHGFDGTVENRNKTVAGGFDELSVVSSNAGLDQAALDPLHATVRSFFIDFHQPAVARDIASDDRSKAPRRRLARGLTTLARFKIPNFAHGWDSVSLHRKRQC